VRLLADSPVDALAQEVRVAHVPRILLDDVHQRFAHRDAVLLAQAIVEATRVQQARSQKCVSRERTSGLSCSQDLADARERERERSGATRYLRQEPIEGFGLLRSVAT
jgi:hypothetical protein